MQQGSCMHPWRTRRVLKPREAARLAGGVVRRGTWRRAVQVPGSCGTRASAGGAAIGECTRGDFEGRSGALRTFTFREHLAPRATRQMKAKRPTGTRRKRRGARGERTARRPMARHVRERRSPSRPMAARISHGRRSAPAFSVISLIAHHSDAPPACGTSLFTFIFAKACSSTLLGRPRWARISSPATGLGPLDAPRAALLTTPRRLSDPSKTH